MGRLRLRPAAKEQLAGYSEYSIAAAVAPAFASPSSQPFASHLAPSSSFSCRYLRYTSSHRLLAIGTPTEGAASTQKCSFADHPSGHVLPLS